jgi:parallel beta-helix repeat protein
MPAGNVPGGNYGYARGQSQVLGFGYDTAIDSHMYGAPGGRIYYVDPNNAQATDGGNTGQDPTVPLATIAAAIVLCRPYAGDTIVVGANDLWQYSAHVRPLPILEEVVIPPTKGGIHIVGMATNPLACSWSPTTIGGVALTIHAMDVLVEGFTFSSALANGIGILIEWDAPTDYGESATIRNCVFDSSLDYGVQLDYCWYNQIYNNYFEGVNVAAIFNLSVKGDPDFTHIHNNAFFGNALTISLPTTDACFIYANRIYAAAAGANNMIDLTGWALNTVADNYLSCTIAQYDTTCSDATSGAWLFNHCSDGSPVAPPT